MNLIKPQLQEDELKNAPKSRPQSMTRMQVQESKSVKSRSTQVCLDGGGRGAAVATKTKDIGTQYEESLFAGSLTAVETDYKEKVEKVEINRVLLSGNCLNSNITNFVSSRLEKLGVNEEVWDLFQLVLDDVNSNLNDAKK